MDQIRARAVELIVPETSAEIAADEDAIPGPDAEPAEEPDPEEVVPEGEGTPASPPSASESNPPNTSTIPSASTSGTPETPTQPVTRVYPRRARKRREFYEPGGN